MEKQLRLVRAIAIIVSLVAVAAFFLPFTNATEEFAEYLELHGDEKLSDTLDVDMTLNDMKNPSLYTYAKAHYQAGKEFYKDESFSIVYLVLIGGVGFLAAMSLLWSLTKRPVLLLQESLLLGGLYYDLVWSFSYRGIAPSSRFVWGIAYYLIYPCPVILLICSIWMFIVKRKIKKERRKMNASGRY